MVHLPEATAYGGVLISIDRKILLREPTNHYGGYAWTFAKGRPDPGETPAEAALREVFEETGYRAEILGALPDAYPGDTSTTAFFLMGPLGKQGKAGAETATTRWVGFDEAAGLIGQTTSKAGRARDLAVLRAAEAAMAALPWARRPACCREDWKTKPLPKRHESRARPDLRCGGGLADPQGLLPGGDGAEVVRLV